MVEYEKQELFSIMLILIMPQSNRLLSLEMT